MNDLVFNIRRCGVMLLVSAMLCGQVSAQINRDSLEKKFIRYQQQVLQEKLYMHVDRTFYLAGDIMWFKIYAVDASFHRPLDVSKVAYVELINSHHQPVLQGKVSLVAATGNGSLSLPVTIPSGNYIMRAYTSWMKNAGADYFFEKQVTIVNTQKTRDEKNNDTLSGPLPDIQFFPEGGNLVTGLKSRIACKVVGANGRGVDFAGSVINENNETVASFRSLQFGMGSFFFTPTEGHTYKAVVTIAKKTWTKQLPAIYTNGYVMRLHAFNGQVTVSVETPERNAAPVYLLVHTRQVFQSLQEAQAKTGIAQFSFDPEKLGEGISTFTLLNSAGDPVCERLFYNYAHKPISIQISAGKNEYPTRSAVDLSVQPRDDKGSITDADMSVAVYQMNALQTEDSNSIQSCLLVSSDLKGYVESPDYYFGKDTASTYPAMDNLMLTQGWRRFSWSNVLNNKVPVIDFVPELNGHIITGKLVSTVTGKPVEDVETYVSVPGLNGNTHAYISGADGKIIFDVKNMRGSKEVILQTNPEQDTLVRMDINNPFLEAATKITPAPLRISMANEKLLTEEHINVQVQNLYAGSMIKRFTAPVDTVADFGKPDDVYFLDNFVRFNTMEEVMREYVALLNVIKRKDKFRFELIDNFAFPINGINKQFLPSNPLMLVDGVAVFNTDKLINFDPRKMRKLEVYNHRYFMGSSFFEGIMNWTTYKGDLANLELDPKAVVIDYEGMQLQREFYSPVYHTADEKNSHLPDHRTLLYWSPEIGKDAKGNYHVNFYTSDKKGTYLVVMQGLQANGKCGSGQYTFDVK